MKHARISLGAFAIVWGIAVCVLHQAFLWSVICAEAAILVGLAISLRVRGGNGASPGLLAGAMVCFVIALAMPTGKPVLDSIRLFLLVIAAGLAAAGVAAARRILQGTSSR